MPVESIGKLVANVSKGRNEPEPIFSIGMLLLNEKCGSGIVTTALFLSKLAQFMEVQMFVNMLGGGNYQLVCNNECSRYLIITTCAMLGM